MKQSKQKGPAVAKWAGVAVAVIMVGAISITGIRKSQKDATDKAAKWESPGPVCQVLTAVPAGEKVGKTVAIKDAEFSRSTGHVACTEIGADHGKSDKPVPVCQFSSPTVVQVKTPKGIFLFSPGAGQPATVAVRDGTPECAAGFNPDVFNDKVGG